MSQEPDFNELWTTLCANEQYSELCTYIRTNMSTIHSKLTEFRTSVYDCIPSEAREKLDHIMFLVCHPPPGCGG
jgi:septation ring formation regulator EzrA